MKSIHKADFAARIRAAREGKRESQETIAKQLGVSRQSVNAWESANNPTMPKGATLDSLLRALDIQFPSVSTSLITNTNEPALQLLARTIEMLQYELKHYKLELASFKEMRENDIARLEKDKERLYVSNVELNERITALMKLLDHPEISLMKGAS